MMTCKKDVEPYVFNAEIKVSDIRAKQVLVEAINDEEGFEKLSAFVYCSTDEKLDELKQYEMTYEDDRFKAYLTELQDGTRYYYKVVFHGKYNSVETEIDTFETEKIVLPAVTTMQVSDVTTTSAKCGGEVTSEGNGTVTARGVCWSVSPNPTIEDNKTNDGSGTGSFASQIPDLVPNTQYYVRAYATNEVGTAYGDEISFTTLLEKLLPTVTTSDVTDITSNSATCGGNVISDGNGTVTARGICWSISQNPTIEDNKTNDGSGTGSFASNLSNLVPQTTYYVRAYATNEAGTVYGEVRSFTTLEEEQPSDNNVHDYVDLGLSVKWATCNVGASLPEEYGDYFAWGETKTTAGYDASNCPTYGLSISELQSQGYIDSEGNLTAQYDAATANWGENWRMPTYEELNELIDNCTWTWTTQNGVNGYKVEGPNGSSIFLPAAGYRYGSSLDFAGSTGHYWSSTPDEDDNRAFSLSLYSSGSHYTGYSSRVSGLSVRPVFGGDFEEPEEQPETPGTNQTFNVNGVSFTMIAVEGGIFKMGAQSSDSSGDNYDSDASSSESPVHSVTLSSYYIGETEVTQELWEAVMGSNPSYYSGYPQRPVESVSWNDCQEFITKLNQLTGRNFRLPTEAEWEYAARGGNKSKGYKYSGSNTIDDVAWYTSNSSSRTHDVKTKQVNELGIYDMSGNVWEWCQDWYGSYSSGSQTNPTRPASGSYRVLRGGGWNDYARDCRVSNRYGDDPGIGLNYHGLRLAL